FQGHGPSANRVVRCARYRRHLQPSCHSWIQIKPGEYRKVNTSFTNSKVLVVGGAGFVGSNLCHYLLAHEPISELWIVDNLLSSDISNVPENPKVRFVFGSIAD